MYRHLDIYSPVISLIKDNIQILELSQDNKVKDLFRLCFAFLTAFARENHENQLVLSNSIVVFQYNMHANLGHIKLLVEIFKNNLTLCTNQAKLKEVIDNLVRIIMNTGRKAEYLDFFKAIQRVNGRVFFNNQKLVLDTFLDPATRKTLLYLATEEEVQEIANNDPKDQKLRFSTIFG